MNLKEIGQAIKQRRRRLKVNQQDVADLAGVSINTLVAVERGMGNPTMTSILAILQTVGLEINICSRKREYEKM